MPLPRIAPVQPVLRPKAFDHPDWIFELKYDGFRALAYIEKGICRFVSRNGSALRGFHNLEQWLAKHLDVGDAILDGELCCLDAQGRPRFNELETRAHEAHFIVFDLLWVDHEDLRQLPLMERKHRLARIVPAAPSWLVFLSHIEACGRDLFGQVRGHDLEGIVAKRKTGTYDPRTVWYKIKNPDYSQGLGRQERFISYRGYNDIAHVNQLAREAASATPKAPAKARELWAGRGEDGC